MSPAQASLDRLLERAARQCLNQTGGMKLTHRTPHPPTLITAGIKDDEVLFDILIGGKFKGVWRSIDWHYGTIKSRNTTQNAAFALMSAYPQVSREIR